MQIIKNHSMEILSKNTIETWIIPHLTVGSKGFDPTVPIHEIIEAILHRLKTGRFAAAMSMARITHKTVFQ